MSDALFSDPFASRRNAADRFDPRATRIEISHRDDVAAELWFGGSYTNLGEPVHNSDLGDAWLIDCAGETPDGFRSAAAACFMRVFEDMEWVPPLYARIDALAKQLALALIGAPLGPEPELPAEPPSRVYVICQQGFNRSALVAGRILRELGAPADHVVSEMRRARPGALANATFVRLIED